MRSKRKYRGKRSKVSRKRTYRKRTYRKRTYRKRTYRKRTYKKSRVNKRILQRGGSPKRNIIQTFANSPGRGELLPQARAASAQKKEDALEEEAPTRYPPITNNDRVSRWLTEASVYAPESDPMEAQLQEALGRLSSLVRVETKKGLIQCLITHDLSSGITEIFKEQGTEAVVTFDFSSPYSSFALDTNDPKRLTLDNSVHRNSLLFDDEVTCAKFLEAFRALKAREKEARRRREEAQRRREALERVAREQEAQGRLSSLVRVEGAAEWIQCLITHDPSSGTTEISREDTTKERGTKAVATFDFLLPGFSFALDTNDPKRLTLDNSVYRTSLLFDDEVTCVKFLDAFRSRKASVSFRIEKLLGEGQGGRVFKVRQMGGIYNSCHYAMKSISKNGEKECAVTERDFLEEITKKRVPFVVRMHYSFQDREKLYMGIDYLTRGDLAHHISLAPRKSGIPEAQIKTYAAQIVLAIEGLHEIGIVHRDLKAENIGIDARDNAILLDFGHSARGSAVTSRLKERCCTLENMAPEVLTRKGEITFGKAVDWWGLGTIIYEMRYTKRPFPGPSESDYIEQITHELPSRSIARSFFGGLLIRLLEKNPEERLTNPEKIKATDFFRGIDWSKLLEEGKKVHPPVDVIDDQYSFLDQEYKDYSEAPIGKTITMNSQSSQSKSWVDDFPNFKFNVFYGYDDL